MDTTMNDNLRAQDSGQVWESQGRAMESEEMPCCTETLTYGRKEHISSSESFVKDTCPCASEYDGPGMRPIWLIWLRVSDK